MAHQWDTPCEIIALNLRLIQTAHQVGHELGALTDARTFESLYIDPIVQVIEAQNPQDEFTVNLTTFK